MAFSFTGNGTDRGNASTASITHGLTINSGDLVVAYVNRNGTSTISADSGGGTWIEAANEIPTSQTARQALFWKIANGSEPATYGFTFGSSDQYQVLLKVFSSSTDAEVDSAAATAITASQPQDMVCEASNGAVISDNAVSLIFGGKDNRGGTDSWAAVDNSYTGVLGNTGNQDTAGAHRIYTTGLTAGDITFTDPGASTGDNVYSAHISFIEGAAPGGLPIPVAMYNYRRRRA